MGSAAKHENWDTAQLVSASESNHDIGEGNRTAAEADTFIPICLGKNSFGDDLRILHLTRHQVHLAYSTTPAAAPEPIAVTPAAQRAEDRFARSRLD